MTEHKPLEPPRRYLLWCIGGVMALSACAAPGQTAAPVSGATGSTTAGSVLSGVRTATSAAGTVAPALPSCTGGELATVTPGVLTVATGESPASPWYVEATPSNGQGLESALAYRIGQVLGYDRSQVAWVAVDRAAAAAGTVGGFDLDLDRFIAPGSGTGTADYSTGYFSVSDTVVMRRELMAQDGLAATSTADLAGARLGAVAGSSGASAVQRVFGVAAQSFADQGQSLAALVSGSVDGLVVDTPSALALAGSDPGLVLVGQLPDDPSAQPEQLKALLPEGSGLTGCVSSAIDRLRVEGTLDALAGQWVDTVVPELS